MTAGGALRGGIDLGGTKIQAALVDAAGHVVAAARAVTPTAGGPPDVAAAMVATLREAAAQAGVPTAALGGIGVGSPGAVDDRAGTVASARNLPGWDGEFALRTALERELQAPVRLGNDVAVATWAEFELGAGRPYRSLLGVFWGTGVGGGLILDGRAWHGRGAAGEIGHTVVKIGGARCFCGRRGCLEAYAGRAAMEAYARRRVKRRRHGTELFTLMEHHGHTRLTSGIWARALERDDELATEIIGRAVRALGAGIASAVNLLDVEAVIIGGGLGIRLGAPYAQRIEQAMRPHLFVAERPPAVQVAALGDLGGAIGAALLVGSAPQPAQAAASAPAQADPPSPAPSVESA